MNPPLRPGASVNSRVTRHHSCFELHATRQRISHLPGRRRLIRAQNNSAPLGVVSCHEGPRIVPVGLEREPWPTLATSRKR
jgi:hypothetical protein